MSYCKFYSCVTWTVIQGQSIHAHREKLKIFECCVFWGRSLKHRKTITWDSWLWWHVELMRKSLAVRWSGEVTDLGLGLGIIFSLCLVIMTSEMSKERYHTVYCFYCYTSCWDNCRSACNFKTEGRSLSLSLSLPFSGNVVLLLIFVWEYMFLEIKMWWFEQEWSPWAHVWLYTILWIHMVELFEGKLGGVAFLEEMCY